MNKLIIMLITFTILVVPTIYAGWTIDQTGYSIYLFENQNWTFMSPYLYSDSLFRAYLNETYLNNTIDARSGAGVTQYNLTETNIQRMGFYFSADNITFPTQYNLTEADVDGYCSDNGYLTSVTQYNATQYNLTESDVDSYVSNNGYLTSVTQYNLTAAQVRSYAPTYNLTEAQVDNFVSNNGYLTSVTQYNATQYNLTESDVDSYVSNNGYLTSVTQYNATQYNLTEADVDGYVGDNGYLTSVTQYNLTAAQVRSYAPTYNLTEAQVDNFVSNNGYLTSVTQYNATQYNLTESDVDSYVSNNGYLTSVTQYNLTSAQVRSYAPTYNLTEADVDGYCSDNGYLTSVIQYNLTAAQVRAYAPTYNLTDANIGTMGYSKTVGTVTSVTGSAPIVSSEGTTPAISLTLSKDLVAGDGLNGGADNVLPGTDTDVTFTFDCSEVASTGLGCSGEDMILSLTPTVTTLNTGQGANELYDMDQNVLKASDVQFDEISATNDITIKYNTKLILNSTDNVCLFYNGSHIILANDVAGVTC